MFGEKQASKYWARREVAIYFNSQYTFARLKFQRYSNIFTNQIYKVTGLLGP